MGGAPCKNHRSDLHPRWLCVRCGRANGPEDHGPCPGGGWDQTARAMQQALVATKLVKSVQVYNVAGAGGSVGIAQFVTTAKGDPHQLMVNGWARCSPIARRSSSIRPRRSRG